MLSRILSVFLFCAGLLCLAQAQVPMTGAGNGAPGGAAFAGPGDIVAGATAYYGSKAYTAAYATGLNKAYNVCLAGDTTCADLFFGSNGNVVVTTVGGSSCASVTCTVKIAYDQTVSAACNGSCDASQATEASRPTFVVNSLNSQYCMVFASGQRLFTGMATTGTTTEPYSLTAVAKRTGNTTAYNNVIGVSGSSGIFFGPAVNVANAYAGTDHTIAASDSSFHAVQGVLNGGSSIVGSDGSTNTGPAGAGSFSGAISVGADVAGGGGDNLVGVICQAGWWRTITFSGGNITSLNSQDHTNWGF